VSQHRKHRGYESQRIVADYLRANGWPYAESAGAGRTGSDITGTLGLDWEIKARRALNLTALLQQLAARDEGLTGVGVVRVDGTGPATVHQWPAVLPLASLITLLRAAGYGDPTTPNST
jgi:hypothetical protein